MKHTITQEPIKLFAQWYKEAEDSKHFTEPNFVWLATTNQENMPSLRVVLLKAFDDKGFCFFTNLTSRKGRELVENPNASLGFYWDILGKQVRIEGQVKQVSDKEADDYFATRSRGSQIGAWASRQSSPIEDSHDLVDRVKQVTEQFEAQTIPRPPFWSGFRLSPEAIEFWSKGEHRLHTRLKYHKDAQGNWSSEKLYP